MAATPSPFPVRRRHPSRDAVEGLISALILVLIIRHFVFEVFKIPTGSMAPTLLGQHRDLTCPNCSYRFPVDGGLTEYGYKVVDAICPECGYSFNEQEVARAHCDCFPAHPERFFGRGGNRVIVNKFHYAFEKPARWDVVVFEFPYKDIRCFSCGSVIENVQEDGGPARCPNCGSLIVYAGNKDFIKRLIGLPGDHIEIRHGDIYINGHIEPKPPEAQNAVWQFVYDSRYIPKDAIEPFDVRWRWVSGEVLFEKNVLTLRPDEKGIARASYAPPILDITAYNGLSAGEKYFYVGDLRLDTNVRLDRAGILELRIKEDDVKFTAEVNFGAEGTTRILADDQVIGEKNFSADPAVSHHVVFQNVDDRQALYVDGELVIETNHAPEKGAARMAYENGIALGVRDADAVFEHVRIDRDLYYLPYRTEGRIQRDITEYNVPEGNYFMMGDNTRNSYDSRKWGTVPEQNMIGPAMVVWWPLDHLREAR